MARSAVKTDPLTSLYDLWHPDSYSSATGQEDSLLRARRASSTVAEASSKVHEPITLCVSDKCPADLRKPGGASWSAKDFKIRRKLSSSKTCGVYLAEAVGSQTPIVLKIQSKERLSCMNRHQVAREVLIHSKMEHANIIDLYGVFEDQYSLVMIMEYATHGDVLKKLTSKSRGQLSESETKAVIVPLLQSLAYVHGQGIIHRDIKPENILITDSGEVKLTDFGVCIDVSKERPVSAVGTLDYMSPEVTVCPLKSAPSENKGDNSIVYGSGSDIWGVGVLAFELVSGLPPFSAENSADTKIRIATETMRMPRHFSPALKNFIQLCTEKRASRRPSAQVLLNHAWLCDAAPSTAPPTKHGLLKKAFSGKSLKPTIQSLVSNSAQQMLSSSLHRSAPATSPTPLPGVPSSPSRVSDNLRPVSSLPPVELPSLTAREDICPTHASTPNISTPKNTARLSKSKSMRTNPFPVQGDHYARDIGKALNSSTSKVEARLQPTLLFSDRSAALKAFKAGMRFSCA